MQDARFVGYFVSVALWTNNTKWKIYMPVRVPWGVMIGTYREISGVVLGTVHVALDSTVHVITC